MPSEAYCEIPEIVLRLLDLFQNKNKSMALLCRQIGFKHPFAKSVVYHDANNVALEAYDAGKGKEKLTERAKEALKLDENLKRATDKINKAYEDKKLTPERHQEFVEAIQTLKDLEAKKDSAKYKDALKKFDEVFADLELTSTDYRAIMLALGQVDQKISSEEKVKETMDGKRLMSREFFIDPTNNGPLSRYALMTEGLTYKVDFKGDRKAELAIGLKDMTSNNVVEVRVTHKDKKTGATTVMEGRRAENGKFYTSEGKYVAVYTGDTVEVTKVTEGSSAVESAPASTSSTRSAEVPLTDYATAVGTARLEAEAAARGERISSSRTTSGARIIEAPTYSEGETPTPEQRQIQYRKEFIQEAQKRDVEYKTAKAETQKAALESSQELDRKDRIKVPAELKGMTKFNYADTLYNMDHGVQVMNALDALSQVKGDAKTRTEIDMWEAIRKNTILSADTIGFAEVSRAVYGKSPEKVRERYDALKKETKSDEERTELKQLESFYIAANDLLEAISLLKPRKYEWSEAESEYKDENYKKAEQISAKIFDPKSEGPAVQMSALRWLFAKDKNAVITTQTMLSEDAKYNRKTQQLIGMSEKSAFQQLRDSSIVYENGNEKIDFSKYEKKLAELRMKGITASASDPELSALVKANKSLLERPLDVNNLSDLDIKLIRKGYMFDQGQKYIEAKMIERQSFLKSLPEPTQSTVRKIAESGEFKLSNEQLREIAERVHTRYLFTLGVLAKTEVFRNAETGKVIKKVDYVGAGIDIPIPLGHGLTLRFGIEKNMLTTKVWAAHAGLSYGLQTPEGHRFDAHAGAEADLEKNVGIGAGIEVQTPIDKFREWGISLGVGAGVSVSKEGLGRVGFGAKLGVERHIEGAVQRIASKLTEKQKSLLEANIAQLKLDLERDPNTKDLTPEQKAELLAFVIDMYVKDLENQAVLDLKAIQFLGAGVGATFVPGYPPILIPYVKVGFRGNTHVVMARPEKVKLDERAEAQLEESIKAQEKGDMILDRVYISGDLQRTAEGVKTVSEATLKAADITKTKLESVNREIHKHGLRLELAGDKVKVEIAKSDGAVDIFSDPASGIKTYTDGKDVFLNISTAQQLSFRRVDKYYPFNDFGDTHRVELYISDNVRVKNETIKGQSQSRLHYRKTLDSKVSQIEEVKNTVRGTDMVSSEAELTSSGQKLEFVQNPTDVREAREAMRAALQKGPERLSESRKYQLDEIGRKVLAKYPKTYRELSTSGNYAEIAKQISEASGTRLNNTETTYVYQSMMMESLAKEPNKKGLERHIKDWNQRVLTENLQRRMDDDAMAASIADKITTYYQKKLESGSTRTSSIERGTTVQIQVGTMKIEGYREAFYSPTGNNDLYEAVQLTKAELIGMGLSEQEAKMFMVATTEQLSPLSDKPEELLRSTLGLYVLDGAEIIFGAKKTKELAEVVRDPSKAYTSEVYKEFETLVRALRREGEVKYNGLILRVSTKKEMALFDKCKNLTITMNEKLTILIPETQAASAEVKDYVQGKVGAKFYGVGVAVAYGRETIKKTPPARPPKQEGEKDPTGEVESGDTETRDGSDGGSDGGDGSHAGEVPPAQ